jgi:hypothetical protein
VTVRVAEGASPASMSKVTPAGSIAAGSIAAGSIAAGSIAAGSIAASPARIGTPGAVKNIEAGMGMR